MEKTLKCSNKLSVALSDTDTENLEFLRQSWSLRSKVATVAQALKMSRDLIECGATIRIDVPEAMRAK